MFRPRRNAMQLLQLECERSRRAIEAADAERVRLRTALDALSVGVVLSDQHGVLQVRNDAASRFTGHEGVLVAEAVKATMQRAAQGHPSPQTVEFYGPPRRVLLIQASTLAEGFTLATIDDVSERARLDAVRTDFVANISHELKTPVGALAVLAEATADSDDIEVMRRLAGRMVEEAHRAAGTIDDLLELSRIELGGRAVQDAVDVQSVLIGAIERARTTAEQRDIELVLDVASFAGQALGDSRQLVSAVTNLIDNAVKYSDPGSRVTVSSECNGPWVDLIVSDQGVGIPARDLDRIFERFYRVDQARSRTTGGTGLGLAIVRHVATNHGGDVLVRSKEGEGSVFTLRVPKKETSN